MTVRKQRLTVTVDPDLVEAGARAAASGEADSLSGLVSAAMADKAYRDRKLEHLRDAITSCEAAFGEIEELQAQRGPSRQARLAQALAGVDVIAIDKDLGRAAGVLLGRAGLADVVAVTLVLLSRTQTTSSPWITTISSNSLAPLAATSS